MSSIGFFYTCYNEERAVNYSVDKLKQHYPDSPVYLVSEGNDFSYLEEEYESLVTSVEEDTMSPTFGITGDFWNGTFREDKNQKAILNCAQATINRLKKAVEYCKTDYIVMCDPDTLIRGQLTIPEGAKILGTKLNQLPPEFSGLNDVIQSIDGAIPILRWGAVPVIGHTQTLLKGIEVYLDNFEIVDKLSEQFHVPGTFDLFLPILFALAGEQEVFSDEYTECMRNPNWKTSGHPVVHQYREFYDEKDYYGVN